MSCFYASLTAKYTIHRLPYQPSYSSLLDALRKAHLGPPEHGSDPLREFPGARAILQDRAADFVSPSLKNSLGFLLDEAICLFGFSPGDVYNAVFDHQCAVQGQAFSKIGIRHLMNAIIGFPTYWNTNYIASDYFLAISPVYPAEGLWMVTWTVDFKSDWVARNFIQKLTETEDESIWREVGLLQRNPHAQALVGRFPEPVFHSIADSVMDS